MKHITIIIYHGSPNEEKNKSFLRMIERLQTELHNKVVGCFLEFGSPLWKDTWCTYSKGYQLTILPLIFLRGKHYEEDIIGKELEVNPSVNLLSPLVEDSLFRDYIQQNYRIKGPLVLAAHGSDHNTAGEALSKMARELSVSASTPCMSVLLVDKNSTNKLADFHQEFGSFSVIPFTFGKGKVYQEIKELPNTGISFHMLEPLSFNKVIERYILEKMTLKEGS
ncbi:sirohydrochlorin chelatase [Oceanobacillus kapialis]|uniref:sirohydrochlorin chelatase n=1 Tax=Oceanobacillus kapialis TaxID=481353 RepID=UPI003850DFF5